MNKMYLKYGAVLATTMFLFGNFIACGAKFYQMSLEDDVQDRQMTTATAAAAKDPESISFGIHAMNGWRELPISFKVDKGLDQQQLTGLTNAMGTWEKIVGRQLFNYLGADTQSGDQFKDLYGSLSDRINGHYLDYNWAKTQKKNEVLATTIWNYTSNNQAMIDTADIRFNLQYYVIGDAYKLKTDANREVVDMQSLALHELGHLLGLTHVEEKSDPGSIMTPKLMIGEGLSKRRVSKGDIERLQRIYGCSGESCEVDQLLEKIEYNSLDHESSESQSSSAVAH